MSKDEWFRNYERLVNNGAPMSSETAERARQQQVNSSLDKADIAKKKERGE